MPECIINRAIELYHLKSNCKTVEENQSVEFEKAPGENTKQTK